MRDIGHSIMGILRNIFACDKNVLKLREVGKVMNASVNKVYTSLAINLFLPYSGCVSENLAK